MKRTLPLLCAVAFLSLFSLGQTNAPQTASATTQPAAQSTAPPSTPAPTATSGNFTSAKGFVLEDATPVKLRINRTLSSADTHTGDTVDFEVLEDVSVNGTLVVPKGGMAFATVTEAQGKRRMARGGKLNVNIDYVKLVSSEKAPLRAVQEVKGGGHTGAMTAGIVATGIVFFPAAPFFFCRLHDRDASACRMRGNRNFVPGKTDKVAETISTGVLNSF